MNNIYRIEPRVSLGQVRLNQLLNKYKPRIKETVVRLFKENAFKISKMLMDFVDIKKKGSKRKYRNIQNENEK